MEEKKMKRGHNKNLYMFLVCAFLLFAGIHNAYTQDLLLSKSELTEYAKLLRGKRTQPITISDGTRIEIDEDCGFENLMKFQQSLQKASLSDAEEEEILSLFDIEGTISEYNTAHFNIQYTKDNNADQVRDHTVDTAVDVTLTCDTTVIGTTVAGNNHPDFVEEVGIWLEHSLARYITEGFRDPIPAGSRITVYIETIGALGMAWGDQIWISNTLPDYYLQATPTHELFHCVQSEYDYDSIWILEGTARWSVDMVNDNLNRYMRETRPYLNNMDRDLTDASYSAVIFWKYFSEQYTNIHTEPNVGVDAIIELFNSMITYNDVAAADQAVQNLPKGRSIYSTFKNWLVACYVKDKADPYINPAYDYLEDEQVECGLADGFGEVTLAFPQFDLTSLSGAYNKVSTVNNWAADYHLIVPDMSVTEMTVDITAQAGFNDPLYIILAIKDDYATVYQSRASNYEKVFYNPPDSLDELVVIVAAYEDGGTYNIEVRANEGMPDDTPIDVTLVMDCSGSMDYYNYIEPARNYGKLFVDLLQPEDRIGVVSFAVKPSPTPKAVNEYPLSEIPDIPPPDVKEEAKTTLDGLTTGNTTPLGEGLILGHQEIVDNGDPSRPQAIVLLSDGEENVAPYVSKTKDPASTILSDINSDGIGIYTLILGPSADWAMNILQEIAEETDGHSEYFILTSLDFAEVYMMLRTAILQDDLLRLDKEQAGAEGAYSSIYEVNTDSSTDMLLLACAWENKSSQLDFEIQSPSQSGWTGISDISANPNITVINEDVYQIVRISVPEAGKWRYRFKYTDIATTQEQFVSSASTDRLDINMLPGVEGTNIAGDPILVTARLMNKNKPLTGAQVTANVKIPMRSLSSTITSLWKRLELDKLPQDKEMGMANDISRRIQIIDQLRKELGSDTLVEYRDVSIVLNDNGKNGDVVANDGVYSGQLLHKDTTTSGTYTFTINAGSAQGSSIQFQREGILTTQVDVAEIDPKKCIVRLSEMPVVSDTMKKYEILVVGIDKYNNTMWPGLPDRISIKADNGKMIGSVRDNEDTSYSQILELGKDQEATIDIAIRGVELEPIGTEEFFRWNVYAFGGLAIPIDTLANDYEFGANVIAGVGYNVTHNITVLVLGGYNVFQARNQADPSEKIINLSANVRLSFLRGRLSPYIGAGFGYYIADINDNSLGFNVGAGIDYFFSQRITAEVGVDYHNMLNSDMTKFLHSHAGIVFHF
jgi:opacity protein-like surface antigen